MTPNDLKVWRERLRLTQAEAAHLLSIGPRTYQRQEGALFPRAAVPADLSAACYGANAAIRAAEPLLDLCDCRSALRSRGARGNWNLLLTEEEMHYRRVVGLARRLLDFGELSGAQRAEFCGHSLSIIVPRNYVDPGARTALARPAKGWR